MEYPKEGSSIFYSGSLSIFLLSCKTFQMHIFQNKIGQILKTNQKSFVMKILAYAFPLIANITMAMAASIANSLDCFDNEAFFIEGNPLHNCLWVSKNQINRSTQCQVKEVRENCPIVCGKCCEDRVDFQFSIHDASEGLKNCAWLVNNDKSHCNSEYHGTNVAHACPKACNTCRDPVPFEDIVSLEWSPNTGVNRGRALQTTTCVDDPTYRSPINLNFGCEIYETGGSCVCETFGVFLSDEELQDVLERCQATCRICSESPSAGPTLAASQNPTDIPSKDPTGSPSMTPSKAPTDRPSETPTMTPSKAPTDRPSASPTADSLGNQGCTDDPSYQSPISALPGCGVYATDCCDCYSFEEFLTTEELQEALERCPFTCNTCSASPSSSPSFTRTSCDDNPNFESTINSNFGCEIHNTGEDCDCTAWSVFLSEDEMESLYANCPETCGVPCCEDDPNYVHPIVTVMGCDLYPALNCTCDTFESLMTAEQMQDLYENCPVTCGLCVNSESPSISPTKPPTGIPSPQPSTQPSSCSDDITYSSPVFPGIGCELYVQLGCPCDTFASYMSFQELQEVYLRCPVTCGIPCGLRASLPSSSPTATSNTKNPTKTPNKNPTPSPSLQPSTFPTACVDDPNYISPINSNFGCNIHNGSTVSCEEFVLLQGFSAEDVADLLSSCRRSCAVCA